MGTLPLDDIVKISVNLSPRAAVRKGFNLGLIIGSSTVITTEERVKLYSSLDSMYEDGFREDMPEYKAASLYFKQAKKPTRVAIGRHDAFTIGEGLTEILVTTEEGSEAGKYVVTITPGTPENDRKFVYKTAATQITTPEYDKKLTTGWTDITSGEEITATAGHLIMVAEVDSDNAVKRVGKASIGGASIPLNLPVPSPGETLLEAVRACRNKNTDWYMVTVCGAEKDDILQIAGYAETAKPSSIYAFTTNDMSVFDALKPLSYRRSIGQYSQTPDAIAAIMGYAMGANVKTNRSAFTLMHKTEVGVAPDDLDDTQVSNLTKVNANYYVSRGCDDEYSMFENGVMTDGTYFDEMLNLDMLVNDMQLAILDLLKARPKIPHTEAGVIDIKLAIKPCLDKMVNIGFIAPGKWLGPNIYLQKATSDFTGANMDEEPALATNDILTEGYTILSDPVASQSQAARDARVAPPIYTPIKLAGAIHTLLVQIDVNR